jgi:putative ABC transport system permease protein
VEEVGISIFSLAENSWAEIGFTNEKRVYKSFQFNSVDAEFIKAMQLPVIKGRAFDANNPADVSSSALVNEAFLKYFDITDPVGKKLPGRYDQQIIGVLKDFNYQSLHNEVRPLLITMKPDSVLRRSENLSFAFRRNRDFLLG